jgi:septal ring factor EnvC (AmiA/AmiB activator)
MNKIVEYLKGFDKTQATITLLAVVGIFLFFNSLLTNKIYPRINKIDKQNIVLLAEIEANKNKIKQLEANIEEKNSKIIELENKDKELQIKYSNNNEELNKIRKKYEKINSVDKFNTTDIKGYFSKEYGN